MLAQLGLSIRIDTLFGSPACTSKHDITEKSIEIGTSYAVYTYHFLDICLATNLFYCDSTTVFIVFFFVLEDGQNLKSEVKFRTNYEQIKSYC